MGRRRIGLSDLSPAFQDQAARKWAAAEGNRRKYGNTPTMVNGIRFDSKKEAERYYQLKQAQKAGWVRNLKLQPQFTLVEGYKDAETGKAVRALRYVADFQYELCVHFDRHEPEKAVWETVVEDCKGKKTRDYINKTKMLYEKYRIKVLET